MHDERGACRRVIGIGSVLANSLTVFASSLRYPEKGRAAAEETPWFSRGWQNRRPADFLTQRGPAIAGLHKSLLLGSAAGLVAVAGAQAADLPVKAKPVQYVKICSLYGVGFYYIPGTDMCIKIGGWVRAEAAWHTNGSSVGTFVGDLNNRTTSNNWWRIRGYLTADARDQTEYGTVRGYIAIGLSTNTTGGDNAANQFDANRAFIQWAGFTFGRAQLFFDFFSQAALGYLGFTPNSDTGDGGKEVMAYTAQFGNGFSGSISAEARRNTQIVNIGGAEPRGLLAARSAVAASPRPAAPSPASVAMAAGRFQTSSLTCVLIRLGARHRSPALGTRSTRATTPTT